MNPKLYAAAAALLVLAGCSGKAVLPSAQSGTGKAADSKAVQRALAQPVAQAKRARIRIYPDAANTAGRGAAGRDADFLTVTVIEKGRKKTLGFTSLPTRGVRERISVKMPATSYSKRHPVYREYSVPAGSPVVLGLRDSESCFGAGRLKKCHVHVSQHYFIPAAGKDYELFNPYHVYEIDRAGRRVKVDSGGEVIYTYPK